MRRVVHAAAACLVAGFVLYHFTVRTATGGPDVTTYHNDPGRTGHNPAETLLTAANVSVATFGKVGFFPVDGKVDAQPLYLSGVAIPGQGTHNVLYVATEHDSVYALDGVTGAVLWHVSLLGSGETTSDARSCSQVIPEIGITSTPVIDRARGPNGAMYVVAMSKNGSGSYFQRLHALDVTTGAELFGGPVDVHASFPKAGGTVTFDPKQYEERAALLLINNLLVTSWTSHCDIDPYTGWIVAYDPSSLAQSAVLNVTPNGSRGAFWGAGGGPAADTSGNFYVLSGNGTFDTALVNGFPNLGDYGNGFLKISTATGLTVADYFEMSDTVSESNADEDLGSGGPMVLPDVLDGNGVVRRLAVGAGKDARIYVADRTAMGKFDPAADHIYQEIRGALSGGVFSTPAFFNNTVFYGAVGDRIKAFPVVNARLSTAPSSQTPNAFAYPGATPGISSNNGTGAILWAVENAGTAVLHAYDATNLSRELYNSSQAPGSRDTFGAGNKFITPTIANGHVYVGTANGVAVFGRLRAAASDFDGDGHADLTVFRPSGGLWLMNGIGQVNWGTAGDIAVPGDYNGDRRTDAAVYRPASGTWFVQGILSVQFGAPGDIPVPADYNGDGITDVAVFRPASGTWFVYGQPSTAFGTAGDIPVPGDYLGTGRAQLAVYRQGAWFVQGQPAIAWGAPGDIPVPADYDGDGTIDIAVFRPATATWFVRNQFSMPFGSPGDVPAPQDLDGDGRAELVVFRPTTGNWFSYNRATGATASQTLGGPGDVPVTTARLSGAVRGDMDGDRRAELTLFRPGDATWRSLSSLTGFASGTTVQWGATGDVPVVGDFLGTRVNQPTVFHDGVWSIDGGPTLTWGTTGDVPVAADYDGDGRTDAAVFRNGAWFVLLSSTNFTASRMFVWGTTGDLPFAADFDGDGKADAAVFRSGAWFVLFSSSGYSTSRTVAFGTTADVPVAADYDGDGKADIAVFRPSSGVWFVLRSSDGAATAQPWGTTGDVPAPADYDGDGRTDIAVYRPATKTWYVLGQMTVQAGAAGDIPVLRR